MKVGVVTHHWVPNFGANLQAYAVVKSLQDLGSDVAVVNFRPEPLEQKYRESVTDTQRAVHGEFITEHFRETELIRTHQQFLEHVASQDYDLLVSGSDAVFRVNPDIDRADYLFPNPYWLDLTGANITQTPKRVTLAVSAMGDYYRHFDAGLKSGMKQAVEALDYFSSRDSWTIGELRRCNVECAMEKSPDPVFYLRDLIEGMSLTANKSDPYIAVSTGDWFSAEWMTELRRIANAEGYRLVGLPTPEGKYDQNVDERVPMPLGPLEWTRWIAESSGYLGARYHPAVVALLAMVPVVSTDRYHYSFWDKARSKNYDLMQEFGIDKYCIGKLKKRLLSPRAAMKLFLEQQDGLKSRREQAERWTQRYTEIVKRAVQLP